jgi:hypothetical protein
LLLDNMHVISRVARLPSPSQVAARFVCANPGPQFDLQAGDDSFQSVSGAKGTTTVLQQDKYSRWPERSKVPPSGPEAAVLAPYRVFRARLR